MAGFVASSEHEGSRQDDQQGDEDEHHGHRGVDTEIADGNDLAQGKRGDSERRRADCERAGEPADSNGVHRGFRGAEARESITIVVDQVDGTGDEDHHDQDGHHAEHSVHVAAAEVDEGECGALAEGGSEQYEDCESQASEERPGNDEYEQC